jgi:hypothetical protein
MTLIENLEYPEFLSPQSMVRVQECFPFPRGLMWSTTSFPPDHGQPDSEGYPDLVLSKSEKGSLTITFAVVRHGKSRGVT